MQLSNPRVPPGIKPRAAPPGSLEVLEVRPELLHDRRRRSEYRRPGGRGRRRRGGRRVGCQRSGRCRRDQADHTANPFATSSTPGPMPIMSAATTCSRRLAINSFQGRAPAGPRPDALRSCAAILAAEGVVRHMTESSESTPARPLVGLPTESFHYARKFLYLNGEAIEVLHQPAAHTDSDVFAFFRRSDVVVAGDVIDTRQLSRHRHRARRQHRGRDRGAEPSRRTGRGVGARRVARGGHDRDSRATAGSAISSTSSSTAT